VVLQDQIRQFRATSTTADRSNVHAVVCIQRLGGGYRPNCHTKAGFHLATAARYRCDAFFHEIQNNPLWQDSPPLPGKRNTARPGKRAAIGDRRASGYCNRLHVFVLLSI
jgi:hypothetical protein